MECAVSSHTLVTNVYGPRGSAPKPTRRDTDRPYASARKLTIAETSTGYECLVPTVVELLVASVQRTKRMARLLQDTKAQWTAIHQHIGTAPLNMICIEPRLIQGHLLWTQTVSTYQGKAHRAGWRDRLGRHNFMRSQNGISLALRTHVQERTGTERPAQDLPRAPCGARGRGSLRTRHCVSCALRAL